MNIIRLPPGPPNLFADYYKAIEVFPLLWCHTRTRSDEPVYLTASNDN